VNAIRRWPAPELATILLAASRSTRTRQRARSARPGAASRLWPAVALATLSLVAACGGSDDAAPAPPGPPTTQSVDATGGKIVLGASGIKTTLDIPAGALGVATSITVTPVAPLAGESARVNVAPSNLRFAQPVTVTFELPAGRTPNKAAALVQRLNGRSLIRASTIDVAARTVTAQVDVLGQFTHSSAASARVLARAHALAASAPDTPPDGTLSLQDQADVAARVAEAQAELVDLQVDQSFERAIVLKLSIAELLQSTGLDGYVAQAEPWLESAKISACAAFSQASQRASAQVITNLGDYDLFGRGVLYWYAVAQALGGDPCPGPSADAVMQSMLSQLAAYLTGKVATPQPAAAFPPIADELKADVELGRQATTLGVAGVEAHTDSVLVQPVVQPLRNAAFGTAVQSRDQQAYVPLVGALPAVSQLARDAQFVDTSFTMVSKSATGAVIDTVTLGRGDAPGSEVAAATLRADVAGSIELSGDVAVLHCPDAAAELLKTRFETIDVDGVASLGEALLGAGQTLSHGLPALLAAAGLFPANATQAIFTIRRADSTCAAALGITDDLLATVTLDFRNAPLKVGNLTYRSSCDAADVPATFPLSLTVACAGLGVRARLQATDPDTLTFSNDYAAAGSAVFLLTFDVTFPVAGRVTMTPNPGWVQSTACPPDFSGQNVLQSYFEPARQPAGNTGTVGSVLCYNAHDYPADSFDVSAGTTVLFQTIQVIPSGGMTGLGTAFTIHVVPTR
jgi:hypothetical protein